MPTPQTQCSAQPDQQGGGGSCFVGHPSIVFYLPFFETVTDGNLC